MVNNTNNTENKMNLTIATLNTTEATIMDNLARAMRNPFEQGSNITSADLLIGSVGDEIGTLISLVHQGLIAEPAAGRLVMTEAGFNAWCNHFHP